MKKKITFFAAMLFIYGVLNNAEAFCPERDMECHGKDGFKPGMKCEETMFDEFSEDLRLTDEQKEKLKSLKDAEREEFMKIKQTMKEKKDFLHKELQKYDHDQVAVDGIVKELLNLEEQMLKNKVNVMISMKSILSQEQFETMQEKIEFKKAVREEARKMISQQGRCISGDKDFHKDKGCFGDKDIPDYAPMCDDYFKG